MGKPKIPNTCNGVMEESMTTYSLTIELNDPPGLPGTFIETARQLDCLAEMLRENASEFSICQGNLPTGAVNYLDPDTESKVTATFSD
jgi:hypothetical protein